MNRQLFIAFCWLLLGLFCVAVYAEETAAKTTPDPTEIQSVINTLENPEARERLIGQLKILAQTPQDMTRSQKTPTLGSTTVDLLKTLSDQLAKSVETTVKTATLFHELPKVVNWFENQITNLDRRNLWLSIIENLAGIMGSAYLAFFIIRRLLKPLYAASELRTAEGFAIRISCLFILLLLELLPIIAFAIVGYIALSLILPTENIRLVAIVWINAVIIVRMIIVVNRFFFAPQYPQFRFLPVGDKTALYIDKWMRCLGITVTYGYFVLQAAFLIGMPPPLYETLLRFFWLLVTGLLMFLILQNRRAVTQHIRGIEPIEAGAFHPKHILRRLASVWHIVAIIYVLMLYGIWALALTGGFIFILKGTVLTALILVVGNSCIWFIEQAFHHGFWVDEALRQRFPSFELRFNRYLPILETGTKGLVYLFMTLAIFQAWGIATFAWMTTGSGKAFSTGIAKICGIILVTLLLWEGVTVMMDSYISPTTEKPRPKPPSARLMTLLSVAHNALFIILIVMSTLIILSGIGINIAPLLAGAGVAGVAGLAIGFGAQKLVQDVITGLFILFEDLISVGDVVSAGGKDGLVEAITIRTIRLRDTAGNVHTIPFSSIGPITNMTRDFAYYVFDVGVSYQEDIDGVMDELAAIGQEMILDAKYAPLILAPLEILGVDSFTGDAVKIKARIKTLPIKQWEVGREFNRRMKKRFDQLAIEMSSSRLTVCMEGNGKAWLFPGGSQNNEEVHEDKPQNFVKD
jgi:small conductance mechanosensitive channel